jgi:O-antigen/teichoic acid export membrane protein
MNSGFRRNCGTAVARSYREEPGYRAARRHLPPPPMATTSEAPPFRRAVLLVTVSSFLVPAAGVLTQPILARALGVEGRGELAVALAAPGLALAVATLGLPEALVYYLAKHPRITRPALLMASLVASGLGVVCLAATYLATPFLSANDPYLGSLILLGMALTIPALVVGILRGAASGRQMWGAVAAERLVNTSLRVICLGLLLIVGELTVLTAVLVSCLSPMVAGVVYYPLLKRPPTDHAEPPLEGGPLRLLLSYGGRVWFGSVASMLLARVGQLLMAPLSSVEDLGLYSVATTISDLPLIVALAIAAALHGVNSKSNDSTQVTTTARVTVLVGFVGCAVLGGTLPLWIRPLFGEEFGAAIVPTLMLLLSALICIPGLMAASGIAAWGRPGRRSIGLGVTLVTNIGVFVILVPAFGVIGACWTSIISNVVLTSFMVVVASRLMNEPVQSFWRVRASDVALAWREGTQLVQRGLGRIPLARAHNQRRV